MIFLPSRLIVLMGRYQLGRVSICVDIGFLAPTAGLPVFARSYSSARNMRPSNGF